MTTNASSWRMNFNFSPLVIIPSNNQGLFVLIFRLLWILTWILSTLIFQYCLDVPHVHSEWIKTTAVPADDGECEGHSTTSSLTSLSHGLAKSVSAAYYSSGYCNLLYAPKLSPLCMNISVPSKLFLFFSQVQLILVLNRAAMMKLLMMTTRRILSIPTTSLIVMKITTSPEKNVLKYSAEPQILKMMTRGEEEA